MRAAHDIRYCILWVEGSGPVARRGDTARTIREPAANRANTGELLKLYENGRIKPFITARYPLEHAAEAIKQLAERRALGKIVVTVAP